MRIVILALAILSAGCARKEPAVEVRTVEVPVIRVQKCLDGKDIPRKPARLASVKRPTSIKAALDLAVAKALEGETYADKADALLRGCAAD